MTSVDPSFALLRSVARSSGHDSLGAAREVGARAARMGSALSEVLDLVERAYGELHVPPPFDATKATVLGWAEETRHAGASVRCEDPLTSLATVEHLGTRITEIQAGAAATDGGQPTDHVLLVIELPRLAWGHELEAALRALDVAVALRSVFVHGEVLAAVSPRRFAVLAGAGPSGRGIRGRVAQALESELGDDAGPVRIWVEGLPERPDDLAPLLAELSG